MVCWWVWCLYYTHTPLILGGGKGNMAKVEERLNGANEAIYFPKR